MGWGNCGEDSQGRSIGYCHEAICDEFGCKAKIDRGLSYACGDMHGFDTPYSCDKYFCGKHIVIIETPDNEAIGICNECLSKVKIDDDMKIIDE